MVLLLTFSHKTVTLKSRDFSIKLLTLKQEKSDEKIRFTESQIVFALKQSETGVKVEEVCRKMGISEATFYNWKRKFGGLGITELRRLRQLEEENSQLRKLVADR